MSDYADLCNETADELEAAHDHIDALVKERDKAQAETKRLRELVRIHRRENWIAPDGETVGEIHSNSDRMLYESALGDER